MKLFRVSEVRSEVGSTLGTLQADVDTLFERQESLREAAQGPGLAALRAEDVGWKLLSGGDGGLVEELDLGDIKQHANAARALRAANPLAKRGVAVRNAYIWDDAIEYPPAAQSIIDNPVNQQSLFSEEAAEELESALLTDGQYFLLLDPGKKEARRVPLAEITGLVHNPEFKDDIWFYRRTYTVTTTDETGQTNVENREVYYPAIGFRGSVPAAIGKIPVDPRKRIEHTAVNRQTGWRWGIPDMFGAVYWSKAYKEYLEANYTLSKALARLAFKVSSPTARGQGKARAKMAQPVSRQEAGSTALLGAGQDLQAINKSGSGIDFKAGTPLAAMVAAALDVPLSVLLTDGSAGGRQGAEAALEEPTTKSMNRRRKVHLASRKRVLAFFGVAGETTWRRLNGDLVHRRLQSIMLGKNMGVLHPDEVRGEVLHTLAIVTERGTDDIPEPEQAPEGNDPGPLSDGTNDARDTPGGATDA